MSVSKHGRRLIRKGVVPKVSAFESEVRAALERRDSVMDVESRIDAHPTEPVILVRTANGDTFRLTLALVDEAPR